MAVWVAGVLSVLSEGSMMVLLTEEMKRGDLFCG